MGIEPTVVDDDDDDSTLNYSNRWTETQHKSTSATAYEHSQSLLQNTQTCYMLGLQLLDGCHFSGSNMSQSKHDIYV